MKTTMKTLFTFLLVLTLIFSLLGCTANTSTSPDATPDSKTDAAENTKNLKDTLVYVIDQEPATMDPQNMSDGASYGVTANLYDTLVWINDAGEIEPMLAKTWEISSDGLVYTFHLRDDVVFHNGDKLTAEDIKYTFDRAMESSFTTVATSFIDSTRVVDAQTFEVTLQFAYAPALSCFGSQYLRIVSPRAIEEAGEAFSYNPGLAGSGPYIFESWVSGESIKLVANENYWGGAPQIKNVTIQFIADENTKTTALLTGECDYCSIPFLRLGEIDAAGTFAYDVLPGQTVNYIGFDTSVAPFDNALVRQAFAYCCDKEEMLLVSRGAMEGGTLTATPVQSNGFGFNPDLELYPRDLEKAKALLDEAGYSDGFECTIYLGNNDMRKAIATYLQDCLSKIGVSMKIEIMDQAALLEDIKSNSGKIPLFIMGANAFANDADLYLYSMYHSSGSVNFTHVKDAWLDEKLEAARACVDETERAALYKEITQYIYDNCYDIPNFWLNTAYVHDANLQVDVVPCASRYYIAGWHWVA